MRLLVDTSQVRFTTSHESCRNRRPAPLLEGPGEGNGDHGRPPARHRRPSVFLTGWVAIWAGLCGELEAGGAQSS
jgi:hypothetical protein